MLGCAGLLSRQYYYRGVGPQTNEQGRRNFVSPSISVADPDPHPSGKLDPDPH